MCSTTTNHANKARRVVCVKLKFVLRVFFLTRFYCIIAFHRSHGFTRPVYVLRSFLKFLGYTRLYVSAWENTYFVTSTALSSHNVRNGVLQYYNMLNVHPIGSLIFSAVYSLTQETYLQAFVTLG